MIESGIAALLKILPANDVYLIAQVYSDAEEKEVMKILEKTGILWSGLATHVFSAFYKQNIHHLFFKKVLFCSTDEGRVHMARQLGVQMHLDSNIFFFFFLQSKLN